MDQTIKALWVAALRDHETVQGHGKLGTTDGARCCLGVLCDLAVAAGIIPPAVQESSESSVLLYGTRGYREADTLPAAVRVWADVPHSNPTVNREDGERTSLAELNDGLRDESTGKWLYGQMTFAAIADIIDAQL